MNEVGVAESHRRRGLAAAVLRALFAVARRLGCREAWVPTERTNAAALRLYASLGGVEPPGEVVYFTFALDDPADDPDAHDLAALVGGAADAAPAVAAPDVRVLPAAEEHLEGFNRCVDAVARERRYIGVVEGPPLEQTRAFVSAPCSPRAAS